MNCLRIVRANMARQVRLMSQLGDLGCGAGKGGGGGGPIRAAGGAFGRLEAAREEEFYHRKQNQQLKELKAEMKNEIPFHREEIRRHQEAIDIHTGGHSKTNTEG
ncbi:hypothetical protein NQ317_003993 [Molorchus minor]|uniref:ATPase inhibitor n=1 Tax=Molorchus minor TaxID=1323400 RepID=A0ABQ9K4G4_9CUCU|nr:hypothetical protein NQ317_003993 [Molorchus minor]